MLIESFQNEKVKYITKLLTDNRFRKKSDVFVVEGQQENDRAQKYHFEPWNFLSVKLFFRKNFPKENSSCQRKSVRKNRLSRNFGRNYRSLQNKRSRFIFI
jgi:hypothetical protein